MDPRYYQGSIRSYASFWLACRELPLEERLTAFFEFYMRVKADVEGGHCSLREAGRALKPGCYDRSIYSKYEADISFVQDAVEDMIIVATSSTQEAKELWNYIVSVMDALAGLEGIH